MASRPIPGVWVCRPEVESRPVPWKGERRTGGGEGDKCCLARQGERWDSALTLTPKRRGGNLQNHSTLQIGIKLAQMHDWDQSYLQRIGEAKTPICPHSDERVPESLTHFACLCPKFKFREARTFVIRTKRSKKANRRREGNFSKIDEGIKDIFIFLKFVLNNTK